MAAKVSSTHSASVEVDATVDLLAVPPPKEKRVGTVILTATSAASQADAVAQLRAFASAILAATQP